MVWLLTEFREILAVSVCVQCVTEQCVCALQFRIHPTVDSSTLVSIIQVSSIRKMILRREQYPVFRRLFKHFVMIVVAVGTIWRWRISSTRESRSCTSRWRLTCWTLEGVTGGSVSAWSTPGSSIGIHTSSTLSCSTTFSTPKPSPARLLLRKEHSCQRYAFGIDCDEKHSPPKSPSYDRKSWRNFSFNSFSSSFQCKAFKRDFACILFETDKSPLYINTNAHTLVLV